jgi:hypothetical protein
MTVVLGTTLLDLSIHNLDKEEGFQRIEEGKTTGTTTARQFIGALVSRFGQTSPNIHLCAEVEALTGLLLGYNGDKDNTIPSQGYYYNDYDQPFVSGKWIWIGIMKPGGIYLCLSATNITIAIDNKMKCVDGVLAIADTNDNYQFIAEQVQTKAANTRKYFYARFVKN